MNLRFLLGPSLTRRAALRRIATSAVLAAAAAIAASGTAAQAQRGPIIGTYPNAGDQSVWAGTTLSISFDRAMDPASVAASFSLQPATAGRMRTLDEKQQYFSFESAEPLAAATKHTAVLAAGLKDARGNEVLASAFSWSFTTSADGGQSMSFGWSSLPLQFLSPGGPRRIAVQPGYPRITLDAKLYALDEAGLIERLSAVELARTTGKELKIPTAGLPVVAEWQGHVDTNDAAQALLLPASVGSGAYVIDAGAPRIGRSQGLLVVTEHGLVAKRGLDGLTAWLTTVPAGTPTGGAALSLYDAAGQRIGDGTTNADGIGTFGADRPAAYIVGRVGGAFTLVGLSGSWQSGGFWWGWRDIAAPGGAGSAAAGLARQAAHIHTDRPIYRPGHTVHWKASLRAITLDGYRVLDATTPVTVTVRDANRNQVSRARHASDGYGSVHGELVLDSDASRGNWSLEVATAAQTFYGSFQVEDYVKPDYEVTISTDRPWYVKGDTANVTVAARYYFGQPAAGAAVVLRTYYGWGWRGSGQAPLKEYTAVLDADGKAVTTIQLPVEAANQLIAFEAEVTDASRRPVVAEASAMVYPARFELTLENERYGLKVGEALAMTLRARDHDGAPVAGVKATVSLKQWDGNGQVVRRTVTATTGADGTAPVRIEDLKEGWYELQADATDGAGNPVVGYGWAWFYDAFRPWYWWGESIELRLDRDSYRPGDTAQLLIKSPVTTTALVTIERDAVHSAMVVPVSGATTVAIPVTAELAPNAYVTVSVWKKNDARTGYNRAEGQLLTASVALVVPAEDKRLKVEVVPDNALHAPGDEGRFTLRVTDAGGAPVQAQLSFALVDKAVLALAKDTSGSLFDTFWKDWTPTVGTFDSLRPTQGYGFPEADAGGPGRGGGAQPPTAPQPGDKNRDDAATTEPAPRKAFPDTAFWKADLETNASGEVTVSLTLPDSLTTWVGFARAIAVDARVGEAKGEVTVTKDVQADLALPRFAVQGDRFAVDILGRNYARPDGALAARTTLDAPGLVQLDPGARDLALPFNTTQSARYSVVASQVGDALVTAGLTTDAGNDALAIPLPIKPFAVPERFVRAGAVESAKVIESYDVPYNAHPDASSIEVRLAPGVAASILDGVESLIGYPYGCVEQTMSRMLPNAIVGRLVKQLGIEAPAITDVLPEYMNVGLQKLYGFQNADGSWGWWGGVPENYYARPTYLTAYVLHGLVLSRDAGFDVDAAALDRGFAWLAANTADEPDARLKAYAAYVLVQAGRGDVDMTMRVYAARANFEPFARAMLVLALDGLGRDAEADIVLDELIAQAEVTGADAFWPMVTKTSPWGYPEWDGYHWRTMASAQKYTATALQAVLARRPNDAIAVKAAHWLMGHRDGAGWYTTHDTAFAVLGLTDFAVERGELASDYDWRVVVDGQTVAGGHVDRTNVTRQIPPIQLSGAALQPGVHQLTVEKTGQGAAYFTVVGQLALYYDGFAETKAAGLGIDLARSYTPLRTAGDKDAVGDWAVGDIVNVHVSLTTKEDLSFVLIEDLLPAGLEALNEALDTESKRVPDGQDWPWHWRWWGYERKEVRDEGATFFSTYLPAGTHSFDYAARAITPGEFSARPAQAYAMYRPEVWGRSASAKIVVAPSAVRERPPLAGDFDRDCRLTGFDASLVAASWTSGLGRDVNGDGRTSVADVALAGGRAGAMCGQTVGPPPAPSGTAALHAAYPSADIGVGTEAELTITALGDTAMGALEVSLAVPSGWEFVGAAATERLAGADVLAAEAGRSVRVAAFAPVDGTTGAGLLRITLRRVAGEGAGLSVTGAEVTTAAGRPYGVTIDGEVVTPPVRPDHRNYLPNVIVSR